MVRVKHAVMIEGKSQGRLCTAQIQTQWNIDTMELRLKGT